MASPYPHYVWAFGHFLVLAASIWYFKAYITLKSGSNVFYYRTAFTGAIASYAIVCYKSLGMPQPNAAYVQRALADENVQYFIMAIIWWFSKPVPLALVPYAIFSLFHALTFTRTTILPIIFKPAPAAPRANGQAAPPAQSPLAKTIGSWVKSNYDIAMVVVARLELLILLRTVLGVATFQNSLIIPLVYAHFLRARYFYSTFTREAVDSVTHIVDGYANKAGTHPMVGQVWGKVKMAAGRWAGGVLQPAGQPGVAPAAAAAR